VLGSSCDIEFESKCKWKVYETTYEQPMQSLCLQMLLTDKLFEKRQKTRPLLVTKKNQSKKCTIIFLPIWDIPKSGGKKSKTMILQLTFVDKSVQTFLSKSVKLGDEKTRLRSRRHSRKRQTHWLVDHYGAIVLIVIAYHQVLFVQMYARRGSNPRKALMFMI
jgi:hypothetical protein